MPSSKPGKASITVRCSQSEYLAIKHKAQSLGMELSEYVRFVCLNAQIEVKVKEEK
ncbi:hypothetical protein LPY66_18240 [Dehalobacter sp. DCM]|uniref:plasmid mobilization protein n=1 Tax=Dehalobacter sp. DCM TaxID=2907827 RepID=UPI0030820920|nr:hypothetical protein LPY66_18240 [Dehalobacter sp. DCM]